MPTVRPPEPIPLGLRDEPRGRSAVRLLSMVSALFAGTLLVTLAGSSPAEASVCHDFPYSGEQGMIDSACRENTIDPGRYNTLTRADLTAGRANQLLNDQGFTDDWIWYAPETTRTFTRGDGQVWSFCNTYDGTGDPDGYFTTGGFVCDGTHPLGTDGNVMYSFASHINSIDLGVLQFDNGFVSLVCGNFGTRDPRSPVVTIAGHKFVDVNGNGTWETATEPPKAGVTIKVTRKSSRFNDRPVDESWTTTTNTAGRFEFNMANRGPGQYLVEEVVPAHWRPTNGAQRWVTINPGGGDTDYEVAPFGNQPIIDVEVEDDTLYEGETITIDKVTVSNPGGFALTYSWSPDTKLADGTVLHPLFTGPDDAVDDLTLTVSTQYGVAASDTGTITTLNLPPVPEIGPDVTIDENDTFARVGLTYTDPGRLDTHTATVDYGDGTGPQPLVLTPTGPGTGTFDLSHQYLDDDPSNTAQDSYTVTVTIIDDDGGVGTDTLTVTVNNVDPTVEAGGPAVIDEGDTLVRTLSFGDVGTLDTHTVLADFGEGAGFEPVAVAPGTRTFTLEHLYADDDPTATPQDDYTIRVRVTDDDLGWVEDSFTLTVRDVAPDLAITSPSFDGDLFAAPVTIDLVAPFTDPGTRDTFECRIDWDEGPATLDPPEPETVFAAPFAGTSGNCNASNTFEQAGVYTIRVMVTDDDTLYDVEERMIVVYDPSAGFVTGGGHIDSPAGAYVADPTLTGKASFGFVSKYKKSGLPEGNTEFQFHAGDLNFHSGDYEWLVVTANGTRAQYKGTGTINGSGDYGFLLTAYDNGEPGSGVDQLRMKIWDRATDEVVYDNRLGSSDDVDQADPQVIANGNIVIHTKKAKP